MNKGKEIAKDGVWRDMGLKDEEYLLILQKLGRKPNYTELGMFAVLWSEHCGYKHSKKLLQKLPVRGSRVLVGPGENAGVVDLGDGLGAAFKIESHNHPCAVAPYEGAGTGVGGIVRDILAVGARPMALAASLRFGPLTEPKTRFLFEEAMSGMKDYGDTLGIPGVGRDIMFEEPYARNPLCNVLCVGLLKHEDIHKGLALGVGNVVMILGHLTGRDGIHGCTFASDELDEDKQEEPAAGHVGDAALEKLLIEACLEMMKEGAVIGIQDMGAAGITSSAAETAARAGTGLSIDVSLVPVRERDMTPYEIMLSESQERMLLIVSPEKVEAVKGISDKWGLNVAEIGEVNDSGNLQVYEKGVKVADVPARLLTQAPTYSPKSIQPDYMKQSSRFSLESVPNPPIKEFNEILTRLLRTPSISWEQGLGIFEVDGSKKGLAVSTKCDGKVVYLNPRSGTQWAVALAARTVAAVGALPLGVTNCLNFGNPERPEIFWQLEQAVDGMAEACRLLEIPVTGGNVSLYNETQGKAVYPTPVVGIIGLLEDESKRITPGFKAFGHKIALLGEVCGDANCLSGSEYLHQIHGIVSGDIRYPDLRMEKGIVQVLTRGASKGLFASARCSFLGGLAVALVQSCVWAENKSMGAVISLEPLRERLKPSHRPDAVLFGENLSQVVISYEPKNEVAIRKHCEEHKVPFTVIGQVSPEKLEIRACASCQKSPIIDMGFGDHEGVRDRIIP